MLILPEDSVFKGEKFHLKTPFIIPCLWKSFFLKLHIFPPLYEAIFFDCLEGGCQLNALLLLSSRIPISCVSVLLDKATRENQIT